MLKKYPCPKFESQSQKIQGMSTKKLTLNIAAMQEEFFEEAALIGIVSPLPAYRFCWMLNQRFDMNFVREPELDVCLKSKDEERFFSIYQYNIPLNGSRYLLYKLKSDKDSLLPEVKNLDYLWMIQSGNPSQEAKMVTDFLRDFPEVQMAQMLSPDQLKNKSHLLV